jgi:hypothetical protein
MLQQSAAQQVMIWMQMLEAASNGHTELAAALLKLKVRQVVLPSSIYAMVLSR